VSAAGRYSRASQDDAAPGPGSGTPASAGDPSAEATVPAEEGQPDQASDPDNRQPEPDLMLWLQTAEPVSRPKRRAASDAFLQLAAAVGDCFTRRRAELELAR
jgi:hypothetical protein